MQQPEHWTLNFASPHTSVQAEYWVGNGFVSVKRNENNLMGTLSNLHKGEGVGIGWVLLVDTLAGSIILFSLTGVLLWSQINRRRVVGATIGLTSLTLMIFLRCEQYKSARLRYARTQTTKGLPNARSYSRSWLIWLASST